MYKEGCWWEDEDPSNGLIAREQDIRLKQSTFYDNIRRQIAIYEYGYKSTEQIDNMDDVPINENMMTFNHARNVVDTKVAKMARNKVVPMAMSEGGNYFQRDRAKKITRGFTGEFERNQFEQIKEDALIEMYTTGMGFAKVSNDGQQVVLDFIPTEDIAVDRAEGRYRKPRSIYQRMYFDRYHLMGIYGVDNPDYFGTKMDRLIAIEKARASLDIMDGMAGEHNMVCVVEGWHLPSGPDAKDGRHVIAIQGCTLFEEPWTRDHFPFAVLCYRKKRRGFVGIADMYDLAGAQYEHEKVTLKLQKAHHMMGGSHIMASSSANLKAATIDNDQGTLFTYDGQVPPQVFNPDPANPQTYAYRNSIPDEMMRTMGVSPLTASSQIPAGLHGASGKAMQLFEDIESGRSVIEDRNSERWVIDIAKLMIFEIKSLVDKNGSYKTRYNNKYVTEDIDWADLVDDLENYTISIFPVSMLAKTPSAKYEQLQEMFNQGLITAEQFRRLYDIPDLEAENNLNMSSEEIILKDLDSMVLDGKQRAPEPFDNAYIAKDLAVKFYNLCRVNSVPEDRLKLLRNYIVYCTQRIDQQEAKQMQMQAQAQPPEMMPPQGAM